MNVNLPPDLEDYVKDLVKAGRYAESGDVITEALKQHRINKPAFEVHMTPELERLLDEGMEDLEQAKTTEELRRG